MTSREAFESEIGGCLADEKSRNIAWLAWKAAERSALEQALDLVRQYETTDGAEIAIRALLETDK